MKLGSLLLGLLISTSVWADIPKTGGPRPTVNIQVEAQAPTLEQAKTKGFRLAVEQVVGQVIVSDTEASKDTLVKDNIGAYSAGYVHDYEILESWQEQDQVLVRMNVAVASSKIAQRMMSSGVSDQNINGLISQAQIETQIEERQQGDALISQVLSSYPYNAYVVNSGATEVKISNSRTAYIDVPYNITMSKFWLEALNEALATVARDSKDCSLLTSVFASKVRAARTSNSVKNLADQACGASPDMRVFAKKTGDFFASTNSYYFHDLETLAMINSELQPAMGQQHIGLRVYLLDASGAIVDNRCANINTELFIRFSEPNLASVNWNMRRHFLRPDIVGQNNVYGTLRINLAKVQTLGDIARVRLSIEKTCG